MAFYDYKCQNKDCNHEFVESHPMIENPIIKCEKCGFVATKQISKPIIQFKGSGFYCTDYSGKTTI
jgi:putative FmdB family regulatory protein